MIKKSINNSGFTLIELLVGMGIIAFLGTAGVAIMGNFNSKQNINIAYDNLQSSLAEAKSYSLSQVVTSCNLETDELIGYRVLFSAPNTYTLQEVCRLSSGTDDYVNVKAVSEKLPSGIEFVGTPAPITFKVLSGGAQSNSTVTITSGEESKTIQVTSSGIIQDAN